jgi:hypothetical protein
MKYCSCCELVLDDDNFWRDKKSRDGLFLYCKQCCRTDLYILGCRRRAWRKTIAHRSKVRLLNRLALPRKLSNWYPGHEQRMLDLIIKYSKG